MILIITLLFALQTHPDTLHRPKVAVSFEALVGNGGGDTNQYHWLRGELPLWLHGNQLGRIDPESSNGLVRLEASLPMLWRGDFQLGGYFDGTARLSDNASVHASEAWIAAQYGAFRLDAGRRNLPIGLGFHPLSIGSLMMGTNATPPTGVNISTPDFVPVPLTGGRLHASASFGNAWLADPRHVKDAMLHRKHLYLRLDLLGFESYAGIIHNAIWGGTHPTLGRLPSSADDFMRVVLGMPGTDPRFDYDIINVIGNQMAAYDFMLRREMPGWSFSLSRLFYLEDKMSMSFLSPLDGQWGARVLLDPDRSPSLHSIVYDHVYTIQQDARPGEPNGRANYFNHYVYLSGFTSYGRSMNIPLMTTDPKNNSRINNNMVVAHHLGLAGNPLPILGYAARATYSRNYGTHAWGTPGEQVKNARPDRRRDEWSLGLDLTMTPKRKQVRYLIGLAADVNNKVVGGMMGIVIGSTER